MSNEPKPFVRNAADKQQVERAKKKERWTRKDEIADVQQVLSTKAGRRFVWRYLGVAGVFKTSFTGTSQTYFLEGQRNIGLKLLADIDELEPSVYSVMLTESKEQNYV